jgi:hypothetical protein
MQIGLKNIYLILVCIPFLAHLGTNADSLNYSNPDTLILTNPVDTLDSLMRYYNISGLKYLSEGNYELAEEYLNNSLEIKQKILSENDRRIGNEHVNLGVLYEKIWNEM